VYTNRHGDHAAGFHSRSVTGDSAPYNIHSPRRPFTKVSSNLGARRRRLEDTTQPLLRSRGVSLCTTLPQRCCSSVTPPASGPITGNMMSSSKPNNLLKFRQRRTEPQPQATSTENLVKFGRVVPKICVRKNRQTDTLITILHSLVGME